MLNRDSSVLICDNSFSKELLKNVLSGTGCTIHFTEDASDAIERLRFTYYDVVFLDEGFDPQKEVMDYIQAMPMNLRRNIFVILLSEDLKTDRDLKAFSKSVNLIINKRDIKDLIEIIHKSLQENDRFYMVYKETLSKIGKN
jgi:CheY-like chemotaxis protein